MSDSIKDGAKIDCWTHDDIAADCNALTEKEEPVCVESIVGEKGNAFIKKIIKEPTVHVGHKEWYCTT